MTRNRARHALVLSALVLLGACDGGGDVSDRADGDAGVVEWDLREAHDLDAVGWPEDIRDQTVYEVGDVRLRVDLPAGRRLEWTGRVSLQRDVLAADQVTIVSVFEEHGDPAAARDRAQALCEEWSVRNCERFDEWVGNGGIDSASSGSGSAKPIAPGGPTPSVAVRQLRAVPDTFFVMLELYWPPPR